MRKGTAHEQGLRAKRLGARHALARREHLAAGVSLVRGVHHRTCLGRERAIVLEDVEAALPAHVQHVGTAPYAHEHVTGRKLRARGLDLDALGTQHAVDALGFLGAAQQRRIAREILDTPLACADAQQVRGQVDVGHIFPDELLEIRIGDVHGRS